MKKTFFILAALLLVSAFYAAAQIPRTLSYQGVLTDNAGKPRPDGSYSFTFRFYTSPTGGTPIWSESKSLAVKSGLFSTALGEQTPFGAAVKFDQQYWLGIQVGNEPELSPHIALTSVGYSFSSLRADTASVSVASLADTTWRHSGANIYRMNGNVGIGGANPRALLDVYGVIAFSGNSSIYRDGNLNGLILNSPDVSGNPKMFISDQGNIGIGTTNPIDNLNVVSTNAGITIYSTGTPNGTAHINLRNVNQAIGGDGWSILTGGPSGDIGSSANLAFRTSTSGFTRMVLTQSGSLGIGTTNPTSTLDVVGRTKTKVLEITGGMDLAEPFEISERQPIPKGALVIIDEENPGQLKLSHQAYDKRVAGVVSGAGGINPGLTLTQEGVLEGGQNVALSGRVYALATAANGPITPGDLLTTSEVPGHAMKATDRERWDGAIIGKAMSKLEKGEGLVLVLVNLQ